MGLFSFINDSLDNYLEDRRKKYGEPKHFADHDPRSLATVGELELMKRLKQADRKTLMENCLEFANWKGDIHFAKALKNRLEMGVYEYEDILEEYGYTEDEIMKQFQQ